MSRVLRCLLPAAALLLAGCFPTLYTDAPLGEPATFAASEWDGVWLAKDGSLASVRSAVPSVKGPALTSNWRECDVAAAGPWKSFTGILADVRRYGDWYFNSSCKGRLATGEPCQIEFVVLRRSEESLLLYEPDEARIRELVMQGRVPGRIELTPSGDGQSQRVVVGTFAANQYEVLFDPMGGAFKLMPGSAIRLPAELDPCSKPGAP